MAKRSRVMTESVIQKRLQEGRGSGRGKEYLPWLFIHDVPSRGLAWRRKGWKTGRSHHLLSNCEDDYFLIKEWDPAVTDIREQYPLFPLEETVALAEECGIRHPRVRHPHKPGEYLPVVMTTDFVLTIAEGLNGLDQARTIKYAQDLESQRTLEKLEIERRYWAKRNIDWGIVTEREIPRTLAQNVRLLHKYFTIEDRVLLPETVLGEAIAMMTTEIGGGTQTLCQMTLSCDERLHLQPGTCLTIAYHLLATRQWKIDMSSPIQPGSKLVLLNETH
jgi:TnsA endonuclease N terminal/TnsA endonuclease C terminal